MALPRLPIPGSDEGSWGEILNTFLSVEHNSDGTLKAGGSLSYKASVNSPTFTGNVTVPTPTQPNDAASKDYVDNSVININIDTDTALTSNSDAVVASQKATKTYSDTKIPKGILGAKGDILVATSASTPTSLNLGTNGQFLTVDQTETAGLKWTDVSYEPEIADWTANSTYGGTVTLSGVDDTVQRSEGTLSIDCEITIDLLNNQQVELLLHQDNTGNHSVTWQGVDTWATISGLAPSINSSPEATDRLYFERVNGVVYGYHITEEVATASHTHPYPGSMGFRSGFWYGPTGRKGTLATIAGRIYYVPWFQTSTQTFTGIGVHVTLAAAGSSIRVGIYSDEGQSKPVTLLHEATSNTQISSTSNGIKTANYSFTLTPGIYWLAYVSQNGNPTVASYVDDIPGIGLPIATTTSFATAGAAYLTSGHVSGALPPSNPATTESAAGAPVIMLKV